MNAGGLSQFSLWSPCLAAWALAVMTVRASPRAATFWLAVAKFAMRRARATGLRNFWPWTGFAFLFTF